MKIYQVIHYDQNDDILDEKHFRTSIKAIQYAKENYSKPFNGYYLSFAVSVDSDVKGSIIFRIIRSWLPDEDDEENEVYDYTVVKEVKLFDYYE